MYSTITTKRFITISSLLALTTLLLGAVPLGHAYGAAQWQTGFSGNCNNMSLCGGISGFWGWCDFAGSTTATTGTNADCEISFYFFNNTAGPTSFVALTESIQGTAWSVAPGFITPILGINDFFITDGTITVSGPVVFQHTGSGQPVTFTIAQAEAIHLYSPDTGIPAAAGHYSMAAIFEMLGIPIPPGVHTDIQVTQIQ
jgi:hypothetical protein